MHDRITANLPARSIEEMAAFYERLRFDTAYQGAGWLCMRRGDLELEFFPHPELDTASSWHNACAWVADLDGLHRTWSGNGLPTDGVPRLTEPHDLPSGLRMFALVDPNGSLPRCLRLGPLRRAA